MTKPYERALAYATEKHAGQVRKYTNEPYINHCIEVVNILRKFDILDEAILCAAVLHDTVEDTDATFQDIADRFGPKVLNLVFFVTNVVETPQGNRRTRFNLNVAHIVGTDDPCSLYIKCADLISNTRTIVERDPGFSTLYLSEKRTVLDRMKKAYPFIAETPIYQKALELTGGAQPLDK